MATTTTFVKRINSRGFSLLEMMLVLGIMSVVILAMTNLFSDFFKESALSRSRSGADSFTADLRTVLRVKDTCKDAFKGIVVSAQATSDKGHHEAIQKNQPLVFGNLPPLYSGADLDSYNFRIVELYITNVFDAGASGAGEHSYLFDLNLDGGSKSKNKKGDPERVYKTILGAKLRLKLDSSRRVIDCSYDEPLMTCSYSPFKKYPWARRTIICGITSVPNGRRAFDLALADDNTVMYKDFQASDPAYLSYNINTGKFLVATGGGSNDLDPTCRQNLKDVINSQDNVCN